MATIDLRPAKAALLLDPTTDVTVTFTVVDSAGAAEDLTGNTFTLDLYDSAGNLDSTATMDLTNVATGIVTASFDDDTLGALSDIRAWRLRNTTTDANWLVGPCNLTTEGSGSSGSASFTVNHGSTTVTITSASAGPAGADGAAGQGVPAGGSTSQVLAKASGTDYDTQWVAVAGTGDVVGPASAVDSNFASFDTTTGKLIQDSGYSASSFDRSAMALAAALVGNSALQAFDDFSEHDDGTIHNETTVGQGQNDPLTWTDTRTMVGASIDAYVEVATIESGVLRHQGNRLTASATVPLPQSGSTTGILVASYVAETAGPGGGYVPYASESGYASTRIGFIDASSSNGYVGYLSQADDTSNHYLRIVRDDAGVPTELGSWDLGRRPETGDWWTFTHHVNTYSVHLNGEFVGSVTEATHDYANFDVAVVVLNSASLWLPGIAAWALGVPSGDVTGPESSTDDNIVTMDGTSGRVIQDSGTAVSDLVAKSTFTTKGDLLATSAASTPTRLAVGTDGQVLTADSAEATGVKWAAAAGGGGVVEGYPVPSGGTGTNEWSMPPGLFATGSAATTAITAGTIWYTPFKVEADITITAIAVRCTTAAASSLVRCGLFAADGEWQPSSLVNEFATFDTTTTGVKSTTGLSVSAPAGRYLLGMRTEGGNPTLVDYTGFTNPNLFGVTDTFSSGGPLEGSLVVTTGNAFSTLPAWTAFSATDLSVTFLRWTVD